MCRFLPLRGQKTTHKGLNLSDKRTSCSILAISNSLIFRLLGVPQQHTVVARVGQQQSLAVAHNTVWLAHTCSIRRAASILFAHGESRLSKHQVVYLLLELFNNSLIDQRVVLPYELVQWERIHEDTRRATK